jgi:hypothetical protein
MIRLMKPVITASLVLTIALLINFVGIDIGARVGGKAMCPRGVIKMDI